MQTGRIYLSWGRIVVSFLSVAIIFHENLVIVNFVPKFIAMAAGVGRGEILTTPSDSPDSKIGDRCKQRTIIFHGGQVVVNFVPKFVAMATGVNREKFK